MAQIRDTHCVSIPLGASPTVHDTVDICTANGPVRTQSSCRPPQHKWLSTTNRRKPAVVGRRVDAVSA